MKTTFDFQSLETKQRFAFAVECTADLLLAMNRGQTSKCQWLRWRSAIECLPLFETQVFCRAKMVTQAALEGNEAIITEWDIRNVIRLAKASLSR